MNNSSQIKNPNYVLITAVSNEELYIDNTIQSILAQTILPKKWIIVSDRSTDGTDEIIMKYTKQNDFIALIRRKAKNEGNEGVDFSSKVQAIYDGYNQLRGIEYDFIGILDGDVSFDPFYYENVLIKFNENDKLGISGGIVFDKYAEHCIRRSPGYTEFIPGCIQLFRRKCYEDIGGLIPLKDGGEDTVAVIMAQMNGWKVEAFEELNVFHHKDSRVTRGKFRESFRQGKLSYSLGSHPLFEIIKSIRRLSYRPFFLYSFTRMCGFIWSYYQKQKRPVSDDFVKYLRKEQLLRLKNEIMKKT